MKSARDAVSRQEKVYWVAWALIIAGILGYGLAFAGQSGPEAHLERIVNGVIVSCEGRPDVFAQKQKTMLRAIRKCLDLNRTDFGEATTNEGF